MIKFFSVLLIVILNPILLFSFPIQMKDNWKAFPRKNLDINSNPETWEEVPSLTFQSTQLKNFPKGEVINITLYKSFEISQEEYDNLDEDISVLFSYISNVYAVYLNGAKISESGKIENGEIIKNGSKGNVILHFPKKNLQPGVNHFYIVISGMKDEEVSVYGNAETSIDYLKNHQYTTRQRVSLILLSLYFFVGVYHLLLFYKRPQDIYNGFFSMFCIFASLYIFFRTNVIYEFDLDSLVKEKTEYILVYFTTLGMLLFFESFIKRKIYKPTKIYTLFIFIISIITAIFSKSLAAKMLLFWQLSAFYVLFRSSYLMIKGVKEKLPDAKRLMVGFFAMVVCLVLDLLGAMHVLPGLNNMEIAKYGFFIFVMGIAAMLANRFMILHNHVEELNRNLEHKVELRTAELRESLNHVQKLKFQQDGDYFLTSLLIKPLMVNEVHSDKVKIDFFIKQKKTFEFKNKIHEIGGDICIANNITLKNKNYCVFVNGDAMGKSIQGAGGALVLGVVFRAVISRTQINPSNRTPEQWLKSCFVELQNVFVSFDGSMLISVVMGLVDESTGMLFYINAEHPWVILYRDNIASFLEDSLSMRKIGMIGLDGDLQVKTFHLQPEDSLLIGSDGRDDLLLRINEKGERIINEDENLFLRTVEEGKGDLNSITNLITKKGELTDDYTLIKVSYKPNQKEEPILEDETKFYSLISNIDIEVHKKEYEKARKNLLEALKIKPKDPGTLKNIIHVSFHLKHYKELIHYCDTYLDLKPTDTEVMFILSSAYKLISDFKNAIELGESLRLREPWNIKNLINLSDSYRLSDNFSRANKILNLALEKEPENEKAIKLKNILIEKEIPLDS